MEKKSLVFFILLACIINLQAQTKISSETTLQYDTLQGGIPTNRLEIKNPAIGIKYDHKVDRINNKKINDVFGIFFPNIINQKTFNLSGGLIKLGDWDKKDQLIFDVSAQKKLRSLTIDLEIGRTIGVETKPWDFVLGRITHRFFTVEGGILSPDYLFAPSYKKNYSWIAYHPKNFFLAVGNEVSRNWFMAGTKQYKNFGNFTFANYDRDNGNFWFRSQFGFQNVNQKFFSQENYIVAASYLIVPPFFYKHFSPMSTKGKYALKFDGKKTGAFEAYEVSAGRQFGNYGQMAAGLNKTLNKLEGENNKKIGLVLEYYREFSLEKFKASAEFRYEQLSSRLSGYIVLSYEL
jgi:hypothetical protein